MYNKNGKYTICPPNFNGCKIIKDLLGNEIAMLDSNEYLSFSSDTNRIVKAEIKEFLKSHDIIFF